MLRNILWDMCIFSYYLRGPQRGKRDGVIRHILERENGWKRMYMKIGWKKLRYSVNDKSGIQRYWGNLAWTWLSGNFWTWFVWKTCVYIREGAQKLPKLGSFRPTPVRKIFFDILVICKNSQIMYSKGNISVIYYSVFLSRIWHEYFGLIFGLILLQLNAKAKHRNQ